MNRKSFAVLVTILSLLAHVAYYIVDRDISTNDSASYIEPAISLLKGHGFIGNDGKPEVFRTPGYPAFLAVLFASGLGPSEAVLIQHGLLATLAGLIVMFGFRTFLPRSCVLFAAILYAFDFLSVSAANSVMTEALFTVGTCTVFWLALETVNPHLPFSVRFWISGISGLCLGIFTLVRPTGLALGLLVAGFQMFRLPVDRRRRMAVAAAFMFASIAPPVSWMTRNWSTTGSFTLSTIGEYNSLLYVAAGAVAIDDPQPFEAGMLKRQIELLTAVGSDPRRDWPHSINPATWRPLAAEEITQHPLGLAKLCLRYRVHVWQCCNKFGEGFRRAVESRRWVGPSSLDLALAPCDSWYPITLVEAQEYRGFGDSVHLIFYVCLNDCWVLALSRTRCANDLLAGRRGLLALNGRPVAPELEYYASRR